MEILVVNGSPSGKNSITLYMALYLEKLFPGQSFSYLNAAQTIHGLQKDFTPAIEALNKADLILFAYPVYTFIAPSQLHFHFETSRRRHSVFDCVCFNLPSQRCCGGYT